MTHTVKLENKQKTLPYRNFRLNGVDVNLGVRILEINVELENIGIVDIPARRDFLQYLLFPTSQALKRSSQILNVYSTINVMSHKS